LAIKIKTTSKKFAKKGESQSLPQPIEVNNALTPRPELKAAESTELPEDTSSHALPERTTAETPYLIQDFTASPLGRVFSPRTPPPIKDQSTPLASLLPKLGDVGTLVSLRANVEQRLDYAQAAATVDPDDQVGKRASEALMLKQVLQWLSLGEVKD
jgi:hypothetical protein